VSGRARRGARAAWVGAAVILVGCASSTSGGQLASTTTTTEPTAATADGHDHAGHVHAGEARLLERVQGEDGWWELHYVIGGAPTIEVTEFDEGAEPTDEHRAAAEVMRQQVAETLRAWPTQEAALAAGFEVYEHEGPSHLVHYGYVDDGRVLDPTRPEFLVVDPSGAILGAMFLAADGTAHGPQFAGPLSVWHYHPYPTPVCLRPSGLLPALDPWGDQSACPEGARFEERSPEMVHVWLLDHPDGPFASDMGVVQTSGPGSAP
jgi:hypothetical protein